MPGRGGVLRVSRLNAGGAGEADGAEGLAGDVRGGRTWNDTTGGPCEAAGRAGRVYCIAPGTGAGKAGAAGIGPISCVRTSCFTAMASDALAFCM